MNVILFIQADGTVRWAWTTQTSIGDHIHVEPGEVALLLGVLDSKARHNHEAG